VSVDIAPPVHLEQLLATAVLRVGASAAAIVLSRRAGLGTVIGLIAVGVMLGPHTPGPVIDIAPVTAAAEIGVVLLLFVIGLEIEPQRLWAMRRMLFGLGTSQVLATGVVLALVGVAFGRPWPAALIAGFGLSLSSTAFVLQLLAERGEFGTAHGRAAFAVLLLQDMMVVPLLALVPLLAPGHTGTAALPWLLLETAGALALLAFLGLVAVPWALALLARQRDRETFAALAALSVLLAAWVSHAAGLWVSHAAGLSPALGAFLLGVLLSRSPLHHQVAAVVLPFKGLLLGLFFILVGMSIDLAALAAGWPKILSQVAVLVALKAAVLLGLCRLFGLAPAAALRTSLLLVQGSEFGFVLFSAARAAEIIDPGFYTTLLLVIAASMALTPLVVRLGDRLAARFAAAEPAPEPEDTRAPAEALVVGYGRVGRTVMDTLRRAGVEAVAVDIDPSRLAVGRRLGHRVLYGDAADPRLLDRAGSPETRVVVVAVDRPDRAEAAVSAARAAYPEALVLARAHDNDRRPRLERLGAGAVLTETLELGLGLAAAALRRLEVPEEAAREALASCRRQDPYPTSERPKT
jgi:glutathione-regulated potassium-efflux system protein KefB